MQWNENLRKWRATEGYKQWFLAEQLHISQQNYSDSEKGKRPLKDAEVVALAKLYNAPVSEFSTNIPYEQTPLTERERVLTDMVIALTNKLLQTLDDKKKKR